MMRHTDEHDCQAPDCSETKPSKKEIDRHVWVNHRDWAIAEGYKPIDGQCPFCRYVFTRSDNMRKHLQKCSKRPKGELS